MAQHDDYQTEHQRSTYEDMAEGIDQIREVCRAGVAGLMTDGFLEVEARAIIAGVFSYNIPKAPEEGSA